MSTVQASDSEPADELATAPLTDAELRALTVRARASDDALLRRLLTSYVTLRRVTADVIGFIEAREGGAAVAGTPLLLRARRLADAPRR
jgi:lambda repressor-like predicted transcriptional regulator